MPDEVTESRAKASGKAVRRTSPMLTGAGAVLPAQRRREAGAHPTDLAWLCLQINSSTTVVGSRGSTGVRVTFSAATADKPLSVWLRMREGGGPRVELVVGKE